MQGSVSTPLFIRILLGVCIEAGKRRDLCIALQGVQKGWQGGIKSQGDGARLWTHCPIV